MRKIGPVSLKEQEIYLKVYGDPEVGVDDVSAKIEEFVTSMENVEMTGDSKGQ